MDQEISINQKRGHGEKINCNNIEHIPRSVAKGRSRFLMDSMEEGHQEEREGAQILVDMGERMW